MADKHIRALDGVRGIAVSMILFHHFGQFAGFGETITKIVNGAWIGVDLFFVLSGFLITGILLDAKGSKHYFRNFYARRTLRIFPLYYATIAAFVVCALFVSSLRGVWPMQGWLWLYGTNLKIALTDQWVFRYGQQELNHFWSLAVEEHFYLIWPTVVLLLNRRQLLGACFSLIVAAFACRFALDHRHHYVAAYVITPCRVDLLASGAVVAILFRSDRGRALLRQWMPSLFVACLLTAGVLNYRGRGGMMPLMRIGIVYYDVLAGMFAGLVWYAAVVNSTSVLGTVLGCRPLVAIGRWSYGIYVYHVIVRGLMPSGLNPVVYVLSGAAISIAVAAASWKFFEKPILRLKRYFPREDVSVSNPNPVEMHAAAQGHS